MFANAKGKQQQKIQQLHCQEQRVDHIPCYLSGLSRAHFSDNLSRNSCKHFVCSIRATRAREGFKLCAYLLSIYEYLVKKFDISRCTSCIRFK